jgi:sec-independent protein translocase protein TatA
MGNIGPGELLIIALIALLLFGAGRIADIGKGLGQGIKNFKEGLKEAGEDPKPGDAKSPNVPIEKKEKEA